MASTTSLDLGRQDSQAGWQPDSWQRRPALQQPLYPDPAAVDGVVEELSQLPPLVTSWEVEGLKAQLAEAQRGERFLLQGGDCAEMFADCSADAVTSKLKILLQMSLVLVHGSRKRVILTVGSDCAMSEALNTIWVIESWRSRASR